MKNFVGLVFGEESDGEERIEEIDGGNNEGFDSLEKARKAVESYIRRAGFTGKAVIVNFNSLTVVSTLNLGDGPSTLPWR
jgi:hypothetical protein